MTLPPIDLRRAARSLWAKSARKNADGSQGAWLPVLNHLLDVAACVVEILPLEPERSRRLFAQDLGLHEEEGLAWMLALVALHDLGKVSPSFQVLWPQGQQGVDRALPFPPDLHEPYTPHGVTTQATLPALLKSLGWADDLAEQVADAVGCHHGFRVGREQLNLPAAQVGAGPWQQVRREMCRMVFKAVGVPPGAVPPASNLTPEAFMRLAGLTSFADWLGSSFPLPPVTDFSAYDDPAGYFGRARAKAREVLAGIHWPTFAPLAPELPTLAQAFAYLPEQGQTFTPRPLQTALAGALAHVQAPTLVLVEAPMGEGKTEAALYAFLQLQRANEHRGLYLALPTQATGSAMFGRIVQFLRAQGSERPVSIQLAHGGTLLDEAFQKMLAETRLTYQANREARDRAEVTEAVRVEEWFTARKRALLDEYGVGTVDQALLGVLGVAHQFVRLWGLGNRVVVLDEVHAYDTYTSELIAALVAWLRALGSSVVIMSATLPEASRRKLLQTWGTQETPQADYPRWTVAQAGQKAQAGTIPDRDSQGNASRPEQTVEVRALPSAAGTLAETATRLAVEGGCVAVIVNTVQRAQVVQEGVVQALQARGLAARTCTGGVAAGREAVGVLLYHARYPADERKYRENAVLRHLGKEGATTGQGRPARFILIATQVAEQSLDFDADVMITDLAPIDLVLQRAGRLHRHQRPPAQRRGHLRPVLYVAGLDAWPTGSMQTEFWGRVYEPALLYRSWRVLRQVPEGRLRLPTDLDDLVQRVYGAPLPTADLTGEQAAEVAGAERALIAHREDKETQGRFAHIGLPAEFWSWPLNRQSEPDSESVNDDGASVSAEDERPRTRLGEQGVRIVPVMRDAENCLVVCPPPKSLQKETPWEPLPAQIETLPKTDRTQAQRIYRRSLSVSRREVVAAHGRGQLWEGPLGNTNRGWAAHPLLRDVVPVEFRSEVADLAGFPLRLHLHPELGLVYEPLASSGRS